MRLRHGTLYNDLIILSEIKIDVKCFLTSIWELGSGLARGACCPVIADERGFGVHRFRRFKGSGAAQKIMKRYTFLIDPVETV